MKKAFTLAEVLITLTIIGVIAALTIPNLMQRYQEQATVTKVKKFYSTLTHAYTRAVKEHGPGDEWGTAGYTQENAQKIFDILFKPYFKVVKDCGFNNSNKCTSNNFKYINGTSTTVQNSNSKIIVLQDGGVVHIVGGRGSTPTLIRYDVNGIKEPNTYGMDIFGFVGGDVQIFPIGLPAESISKYRIDYSGIAGDAFDTSCKRTTNNGGPGCTAWVIYKGNLDYLRCSDLAWSGKQKCN